jgi:hypothetical protein
VCDGCVPSPVRYAEVPNDAKNNLLSFTRNISLPCLSVPYLTGHIVRDVLNPYNQNAKSFFRTVPYLSYITALGTESAHTVQNISFISHIVKDVFRSGITEVHMYFTEPYLSFLI